MALISLQNISISYGTDILLDDITLQIQKGERISLLGRNGAGKSTFMKIINNQVTPDKGDIICDSNLKVSILPQDIPVGINGNIYDIIINVENDIDEYFLHIQADKIIAQMGLDKEELFENLSVGLKRRVLLAKALVIDPDILLLDEPTNHLDIESIKWMEDYLQRFEGTIFFVTHDRIFLQNLANRIIELDRGKLFDWSCDYNTFLERKEAFLDAESKQNDLFDKKLAQEEEWIRKGIKARRTRNEGRVRALEKMRKQRSERRERTGTVRMQAEKAERSGRLVIEAENIIFKYDENLIINDFSTTIMRGDKIGIIGPNGVGKTTLLKILLSQLKAESGYVKNGTNLEILYFDQQRAILDDEKNVMDNVADGNEIISFNGKNRHVISYLQDFLFSPERIRTKVKVLSGGEKNRLLLAKMFSKPSNVLILDEPTNDLDAETLELLEQLLIDYTGTVLMVSHDRAFINNVVTSSFVFEGNAIVNEYVGGYDDWVRQRKQNTEEKPKQKVKRVKKEKPRKRSFKEKQELKELPKKIEDLENELEELFKKLSDPSFYQNSGDEVAIVKERIAEIEMELPGLYNRWEELEAIPE